MALCGACAVMLGLVVLLPKLGSIASFFNDGHFSPDPLARCQQRLSLAALRPAGAHLALHPAGGDPQGRGGALPVLLFLDKKQKTMHLFWRNNFAALFTVGLLILEVLAQPNLSTSCLLVFVTLFLLMAGGMRKRTLIVLLSIAIVGFFILARFVIPDRWERIVVFYANRGRTSSTQGYQLVQSYYALGNGGWFGTGLGLSKQKHNFLPYAYSDFIFAIVGEELGFVGACGVLGVFLALIYFGYRIAVNAIDRFGTYLALGLTSVIALQVVINVLVVTGFAPTTGIPLPFFTSGGTTMAIFLTTIGLLLVSVSRRPAAIRERVAPPALVRLKERWARAEG